MRTVAASFVSSLRPCSAAAALVAPSMDLTPSCSLPSLIPFLPFLSVVAERSSARVEPANAIVVEKEAMHSYSILGPNVKGRADHAMTASGRFRGKKGGREILRWGKRLALAGSSYSRYHHPGAFSFLSMWKKVLEVLHHPRSDLTIAWSIEKEQKWA